MHCGRWPEWPPSPITFDPIVSVFALENRVYKFPPPDNRDNVLRREFPGLSDAELGLQPMFGCDSHGIPIE